ncbi:hypothetical protein EVAR_25983_1 [Eumeta japonica]|uniref:Uncharacterized protein n=1 Tax=Eumeta variegata TaxID=151549 RepID=A0A4C1V2Y8_EUMVA|nr:hypothetical protein EVAR_25983_1 [Eumeta japonica]
MADPPSFPFDAANIVKGGQRRDVSRFVFREINRLAFVTVTGYLLLRSARLQKRSRHSTAVTFGSNGRARFERARRGFRFVENFRHRMASSTKVQKIFWPLAENFSVMFGKEKLGPYTPSPIKILLEYNDGFKRSLFITKKRYLLTTGVFYRRRVFQQSILRSLVAIGSTEFFFFIALSRAKRVCEPSEYKRSPQLIDTRDFGGVIRACELPESRRSPPDTCNPRRFTSTLTLSWVEMGYLMVGELGERGGSREMNWERQDEWGVEC